MAIEYSPAPEVEAIACEKVIPNWHPHLSETAVCYVFADELPDSKGRRVLAKTRTATKIERFLTGYDAVMIVDKSEWVRLAEEDAGSLAALVDHELCHLERYETDAGDIKYRTRAHDLEEFNAIVARHGLWKEDIRQFELALRNQPAP